MTYRTTLKWMRETRLPYMAEVARAAGVDMTGWTFGQHFGLMWTLVDTDMNRYGMWKTLGDAERGTDDMIRAWQAVVNGPKLDRDELLVTVTGYHQLDNSVDGNPRFALTTTGHGNLITSSNASCSYGITNGWTVNNTTKGERVARIKLTRAGRVCELTWLDGDN